MIWAIFPSAIAQQSSENASQIKTDIKSLLWLYDIAKPHF